MRIISGTAKGIKLETPFGEHTRPTSDRVKEAIFSIIQFDLENAVIFEPFAGSGQLSLEALSRGAKAAYLNDDDSSAIKIINSNIIKTGFSDKCTTFNLPFDLAIKKMTAIPNIDIIFLDPPYNSPLLENSLKLITKTLKLSSHSIIICEHSIDKTLANRYNNLVFYKTYKYSKIGISIYKYEKSI
ncbi:MAG: 16S rRNA (guanine(966)-N(2))-methyltransferase RsmD [Clostridia bacterium]